MINRGSLQAGTGGLRREENRSGCAGQSMESIPSNPVVKRPGETHSLSCRGAGFSFGFFDMHWIRQPVGKSLDWMGRVYSDASGTDYSGALRSRIEITRDNSNSMVYLSLSGLRPDDSAVYYCARQAQCSKCMERLNKNSTKNIFSVPR
ncbi:hypothetical protein ATANTOWER_016873 [Ataeniobius toweri]|uniref:Ig-like domain-containing protein n=1 Tax=Ataeniobius toweri TaxID=208326 RepID=A0ABU7BZ18_9TELE|nr:hypothetical protein [Ataeniobius toweri]